MVDHDKQPTEQSDAAIESPVSEPVEDAALAGDAAHSEPQAVEPGTEPIEPTSEISPPAATESAPAEADEEPAAEADDATAEDDSADDEPADDEPIAEPISVASDDEEELPPFSWYVVKVQSNREDTIKAGLLRRARVAGLEPQFQEILVPTQMFTEFKGGKKKIVKRKLYPGYIFVNMALTDESWFLVRETPGIGDFTGAGGRPAPMPAHEIERYLAKPEEEDEEKPKIEFKFKPGDHVKINEGTFENFEGDVETIDESNGRVTVVINIFNRSTPVELEYWQVEVQ